MGSLRGTRLLSAIFGELAGALSEEEISTAELLEAAQKLIELSKNEYISKENKDAVQYAGYFSYDMMLAFEKYQGRVFVNEFRMWCDEDLDMRRRERLYDLIHGSRLDYEIGTTYE